MAIRGIDISKYQGTIDWAKVKADGVKFALIRVGWCGYDGTIQANNALDPMFHTNMKNAIAQGIDVGVYVYSYAKTTDAAIIAAKETLELVKPYKLTYPIAFDIEDKIYKTMDKTLSANIIKSYLTVIESAKYYGMLYTYTYFTQSFLNMSLLSQYDMWIADYRTNLGYKGSYGIWQYSSKGSVSGINGNVDMNWCYKDYPAIIKDGGYNGFEGAKDMIYFAQIGQFSSDKVWCLEVKSQVDNFPNHPNCFISRVENGRYNIQIGAFNNKSDAEAVKVLVDELPSHPYCVISEYGENDSLPVPSLIDVVDKSDYDKVVNELVNIKTELANSKLQLETYKQTQSATTNELNKVKTDLKNATDETIRLTNENAFLKDDVSAKDKVIIEDKNTIEVLNDTIEYLEIEVKKLKEELVCKGEVKTISVGDALAVLFKTIKDAFKKS